MMPDIPRIRSHVLAIIHRGQPRAHCKHKRALDVQPIPACPPQREQEERSEDDGGDFTSVGVEPAGNQAGADERRAEVACGEGDPWDPARHAGRAALIGCGED